MQNKAKYHSVKSVRIRSCYGPHFPEFGLNTERYFISFRIQSECGEMWTRITPNTNIFYAVYVVFHTFNRHSCNNEYTVPDSRIHTYRLVLVVLVTTFSFEAEHFVRFSKLILRDFVKFFPD